LARHNSVEETLWGTLELVAATHKDDYSARITAFEGAHLCKETDVVEATVGFNQDALHLDVRRVSDSPPAL
jgi:hypothetical protein